MNEKCGQIFGLKGSYGDITHLSLNTLSSSELDAVDPILLLLAMATIPESLSLSKF